MRAPERLCIPPQGPTIPLLNLCSFLCTYTSQTASQILSKMNKNRQSLLSHLWSSLTPACFHSFMVLVSNKTLVLPQILQAHLPFFTVFTTFWCRTQTYFSTYHLCLLLFLEWFNRDFSNCFKRSISTFFLNRPASCIMSFTNACFISRLPCTLFIWSNSTSYPERNREQIMLFLNYLGMEKTLVYKYHFATYKGKASQNSFYSLYGIGSVGFSFHVSFFSIFSNHMWINCFMTKL